MGVEAVVFDIGEVLIRYDPYLPYDRKIGRERRERLFAEVDLEGTNEACDAGAPFPGSYEALAEAHPEWREEILLWPQLWPEMVVPEIPHSIRLLRALKARGVPVFALTNFGDETFDIATGMYPFFAEFDRAFVSARLRVAKPDPAIYAAVEEGTGVAPERLLFTDDKPANIAAAEARGWQGHLFTGPEGWAARLVAEGLLTEEEAA